MFYINFKEIIYTQTPAAKKILITLHLDTLYIYFQRIEQFKKKYIFYKLNTLIGLASETMWKKLPHIRGEWNFTLLLFLTFFAGYFFLAMAAGTEPT